MPRRWRPWSRWPRPGSADSRSPWSSPGTTSPSSTPSRRWPTSYGAQLRLTRLRPSGRGADVWDELHPTADQQRLLYDWLMAHGEEVLTGDSFFHLAGYGEALPGLNLCGAGRVVCLVDPVGDVYACPFAIHDEFLAGNVRSPGGFAERVAPLRPLHRAPPAAERGGLAVRAATTTPAAAGAWRPSSSPGCPSTGPIPSASSATVSGPWPTVAGPHRPSRHSTTRGRPAGCRPWPCLPARRPDRACDESPLAAFAPGPRRPLSRGTPGRRR